MKKNKTLFATHIITDVVKIERPYREKNHHENALDITPVMDRMRVTATVRLL